MKVYKQDVAILSCEELAGNSKGNCKRLVTEYMNTPKKCQYSTNGPKNKARGPEDDNIKCFEKLYYFLITNAHIIKNSLVIKNELRKKFPENLSNFIFKKIVKRIRDLGPCEK